MASIGVTCSICKELLKISEEIYSSNCGHVFHDRCIQEWRRMSLHCPVCRSSSSLGHKIYLNFEQGSSDSDKKVLELKSQLEQSLLNASALEVSLADSKRDFLNIQDEFNDYKERMKDFNKQIDRLGILNESQVKDIESKTIEIYRLQEAINASSPEESYKVLQQEINMLKEKHQHLSLELTKEMRNSTELLADKMRLESMLEHAKKSLTDANEKIENNIIQSSKPSTGKVVYIPLGQAAENKGCIQSVIIKNVRGAFFDESSVLNYVRNLIRLMNINIIISDIQQVSVHEGRNFDSLFLIIKFKTMSSKVMFLSKSNVLKNFENSKDLVLHEFVDDNTNSLFHHAKILKGLGYKYVYCRNNKVLVRKDDKSAAVKIDKIEDIEELKNKAKTEKPTVSKKGLSIK